MELIPCNAAFEAVSVREAGGKGWNLFRLRAFDFPVPDWYVLSSRVFDCGLEPHRAEIDALLAGRDRPAAGERLGIRRALHARARQRRPPLRDRGGARAR